MPRTHTITKNKQFYIKKISVPHTKAVMTLGVVQQNGGMHTNSMNTKEKRNSKYNRNCSKMQSL